MQEATTLIQHNKYSKTGNLLTIILFGREYQKGLTLQYEKLFEMELLSENPIGNLFMLADSKEDVMNVILKSYLKFIHGKN